MNKDIKRIIEKYQFEDTKVDKFILKIFQKDFNSYCKNKFLEFIKNDNYNSELFLISVIHYVNMSLQTDLNYIITENTLLSVKTKNVFVSIPKTHTINESILWLLHDINYSNLLDYILYLDNEISNIKYKKVDYPYLDKYSKVTDYNILFHYSTKLE